MPKSTGLRNKKDWPPNMVDGRRKDGHYFADFHVFHSSGCVTINGDGAMVCKPTYRVKNEKIAVSSDKMPCPMCNFYIR